MQAKHPTPVLSFWPCTSKPLFGLAELSVSNPVRSQQHPYGVGLNVRLENCDSWALFRGGTSCSLSLCHTPDNSVKDSEFQGHVGFLPSSLSL